MSLPAPFAFLRVHPDDGVTVVPDDSRKPGSVVFCVYSEEQVKTALQKIDPSRKHRAAQFVGEATACRCQIHGHPCSVCMSIVEGVVDLLTPEG